MRLEKEDARRKTGQIYLRSTSVQGSKVKAVTDANRELVVASKPQADSRPADKVWVNARRRANC